MQPRVSVLTIGVADLDRSLAFYRHQGRTKRIPAFRSLEPCCSSGCQRVSDSVSSVCQSQSSWRSHSVMQAVARAARIDVGDSTGEPSAVAYSARRWLSANSVMSVVRLR
jgi:hypothetical protein